MARPSILNNPVIGKVYDAGSLPTTPGKFYAVHPVNLSGLGSSSKMPVEGDTLDYSVDTSTTLLFHVTGSTNPVVDDLLVGHYVGNGIWISERMHVTTTPPIAQNCGPCTGGNIGVPQTLTLTFANSGGTCSYFTFGYIAGFAGFVTQPSLPYSDTLTYVPRASVPAWCPLSNDGLGTWIGSASYSGYDINHNLKTGQMVYLCTSAAGACFWCQDTGTTGNTTNLIGFLTITSFSAGGAGITLSHTCLPSPFMYQAAFSSGSRTHCVFTLTG